MKHFPWKKGVTLALIPLFLGLASCSPYGFPHAKGEKTFRNQVFARPENHPLRMDLYVPKTTRPAPVVIWIFGGSWKFGSKGFHVNLRDLTQAGIAVAAIEYRLSGTSKYPAQLEDCEAAVSWLQAHGAEYGIDPQRIGASGESAGGHLAALLGAVEGKSRIRAVCALYPPTDLVSLGRQYSHPSGWNDVEKLLGGRIEGKLFVAREASPLDRVNAFSPPYLLIHGAKDSLVPLAQSERLDRRLHDLGISSKLIVVPDKGHWFLLDRPLLQTVATFFQDAFRASGK